MCPPRGWNLHSGEPLWQCWLWAGTFALMDEDAAWSPGCRPSRRAGEESRKPCGLQLIREEFLEEGPWELSGFSTGSRERGFFTSQSNFCDFLTRLCQPFCPHCGTNEPSQQYRNSEPLWGIGNYFHCFVWHLWMYSLLKVGASSTAWWYFFSVRTTYPSPRDLRRRRGF